MKKIKIVVIGILLVLLGSLVLATDYKKINFQCKNDVLTILEFSNAVDGNYLLTNAQKLCSQYNTYENSIVQCHSNKEFTINTCHHSTDLTTIAKRFCKYECNEDTGKCGLNKFKRGTACENNKLSSYYYNDNIPDEDEPIEEQGLQYYQQIDGTEKNEFWFAVIDSVENRWGEHWFNHYEFDDTIDGLNSHPEIDFILTTGDNVVNPSNYEQGIEQFTAFKDAMKEYLNAPVIPTAGNHDIGSYGRYEVIKAWEDTFGSLDFEFDYGGVHFVGVSNGNTQFYPIQTSDLGRYNKICEMIERTDNTIVFKHIVYSGNQYYHFRNNTWDCESTNAQTVFFGHYGENLERVYNGIPYIQTADANEGHYRLVHVINGEIVETREY